MNSISRPESNLGHHSKLGKFLELLRTNRIGATENQDYGNAAILAEYCGVSIDCRFQGRLQHGWAPYSPSESYYLNDYSRTFVWSKKSRNAANNLGWRNFYDIGAPWLYLQALLERDGWSPWSSPRHESSQHKELWVYGNHSDLGQGDIQPQLRDFILRAKENLNPKTVLLQYRDYDTLRSHDPKILLGIDVLTLGQRTNSVSAQSHLFRLYDLLREHKKLVIDWPSTLLLYAITMGCEIEFIKNDNLTKAIQLANEVNDFELEAILSTTFHSSGSLETYGMEKLGKNSLRSPNELAKLIGWYSPRFSSNLIGLIHVPLVVSNIGFRLIRNSLRG